MAPTTTTTTKPSVVAAHSVTPTTVKPSTTPTTAAAPSTPGGSLSANPTPLRPASLTGVGASSIQPFYGRVLYQYNKLNKGVRSTTPRPGSGPGVTAIQQNTANFGQSEIPMTAAQLAAVQGPGAAGSGRPGWGGHLVPRQRRPGGLQLDGPTLAKIYLRQITNWNDPAIAASTPA